MADGTYNDAKCTKVNGVMAMCKRTHRITTTSTVTTSTVTTSTKTTTTTTPTGCEAKGWYSRTVGTEKCCYKYYNRVVNKELVPGFERQTWNGAKAYCRHETDYKHLGEEVHLATIATEGENSFVEDVIYKFNRDLLNRPVWMGAKRTGTNNEFEWVDGEHDFTYTNWREGEPSLTVNIRGNDGLDTEVTEGCLQMTQPRSLSDAQLAANNGETSGDWNDAKCTKKRGFVCEFCHDAAIVNP